MQRAMTVGLALVCVPLLFAMSGPAAPRDVGGNGSGDGHSGPFHVSVTNLPAVQSVQVCTTVNATETVAVMTNDRGISALPSLICELVD
jgi:hypothetical protein